MQRIVEMKFKKLFCSCMANAKRNTYVQENAAILKSVSGIVFYNIR